MPEEYGLSRTDRHWRAALALCLPISLVSAPLLLAIGGASFCVFNHLTGQPCPLCGGTHAFAALAQGDAMAAWQANPGLLPLVAIAAVHTAQLGLEAWSGKRVMRWRAGVGAWGAGVALLLGGWALRLLGQI